MATVNTQQVILGVPLNLDDGDYIEVFISLKGSRELALYTLAQTDDAEGEEEVDMQGMITDVGIGTDFRYGAASAEPHDTLDLSMTKVHEIRSYPTRCLQSTPHGRRIRSDECTAETVDTDHTILMQRPAPSLAPTRSTDETCWTSWLCRSESH